NFARLQDDLLDVEDQLQYARRYYNGAVRDLNDAVQHVPDLLVARTFGFGEAAFFDAAGASRAAPAVEARVRSVRAPRCWPGCWRPPCCFPRGRWPPNGSSPTTSPSTSRPTAASTSPSTSACAPRAAGSAAASIANSRSATRTSRATTSWWA